ncbi:hypothetical protein MUP00_12245, partial [Candidatus Bathyarchaeota archaeon]|nr:hypothetical protein [Candidatus Bathyarchaeota archaeon]
MVFYDGSSTPQVTAVITPLSQFYLSTSSNVGETTGSGWYDPGSEAEIRATPPAAADGERYAWAGWSGAGGGSYTGDDNPVRVIVNDDINETASWRRQFYLKVVSEHGSPEGEDWYDAGSTATISIEVQVPQSGIGGLMGGKYIFTGWSGDRTSTEAETSIVMDQPIKVMALWREARPYRSSDL